MFDSGCTLFALALFHRMWIVRGVTSLCRFSTHQYMIVDNDKYNGLYINLIDININLENYQLIYLDILNDGKCLCFQVLLNFILL